MKLALTKRHLVRSVFAFYVLKCELCVYNKHEDTYQNMAATGCGMRNSSSVEWIVNILFTNNSKMLGELYGFLIMSFVVFRSIEFSFRETYKSIEIDWKTIVRQKNDSRVTII